MVSCLKMEEAFCHGFQVQRMHDMDLQITARDEGRAEGRLEGKLEGEKAGKLEDARNFLKKGISVDLIAECTGLSIAEIQTLN